MLNQATLILQKRIVFEDHSEGHSNLFVKSKRLVNCRRFKQDRHHCSTEMGLRLMGRQITKIFKAAK